MELAKHRKRLSFRHADLRVKETVWSLDACGNAIGINGDSTFSSIPG